MRWYKKLFWKVFAAIWVVSFLALVATVQLIGQVAEKEKFDAVITAKALGYAELMIERYEHNGYRSLPGFLRSERVEEHHSSRHSRPPRIARRVEIFDQLLQQPVVLNPEFEDRSGKKTILMFTSENGRNYEIRLDLNWQGSPVAKVLQKLLSLQVVLIVLVSGFCAWVISAIIVRPLNRLRQHSRAIYQGQLDTRTDKKISRRGDEIGELAREFDRMAEYVELTLSAQQKLLQDVSHELRAPLARLQAASGLAEQRWGEADRIVSRINRETERLDGLIGEILNLSRLEQMPVHAETYELSEWMTELVDDLRFTYPDRDFHSQLMPCRISLNPKLLERALSNILGNACKHTPENSTIDISLEAIPGCCRIVIRDHGPGVDKDALDRLCEPFYRADASAQGYGLGLSIAHRALSRLDARLALANHPEGGLRAQIDLPCA